MVCSFLFCECLIWSHRIFFFEATFSWEVDCFFWLRNQHFCPPVPRILRLAWYAWFLEMLSSDVQRSCRPRAARFSLAFCNSFTQVLKNTWKRNPPLLLLNRAGWTETVGFVGSEMIWTRSIFFWVCHFEKRTSFGPKKHLLVYEKGYHIFKTIPTCCNGGPHGERRCLSWRAWLPW